MVGIKSELSKYLYHDAVKRKELHFFCCLVLILVLLWLALVS